MTPTERSFRPRPPAPSPSHSLFGLEKAVPPASYLPTSSSKISLAVSTPSLGSRSRSPYSVNSNLDKPLPEQPPSPSSVYSGNSGDSGYTQIVESYGESREQSQKLPTCYPKAPRDIRRGRPLNQSNKDQSPAYYSVAMSNPFKPSDSTPAVRLLAEGKAYAEPTFPDHVPSFAEFSRKLNQKHNARVSTVVPDEKINRAPGPPQENVSPLTSPRTSPISPLQTSDHVTEAVPREFSKVVDRTLVPASLQVRGRTDPVLITAQARPYNGERRISTHINNPRLPQRSLSQDSFTDDSFVIYNGAREVVKAIIRDKIKGRKSAAKAREGEGILSYASEKHPTMRPTLSLKSHRPPSWAGERRLSIQQGVTSVMRKFSLSSPEEAVPPTSRPRRDRQRAIPTTPYQRHGLDVWLSDNKRRRARLRGERQAAAKAFNAVIQKATAEPKHEENTDHRGSVNQGDRSGRRESAMHKAENALTNGTSQIIHALDDTKRKLINTGADKRRARLKASIKHVGAASQRVEHRGAGTWI